MEELNDLAKVFVSNKDEILYMKLIKEAIDKNIIVDNDIIKAI